MDPERSQAQKGSDGQRESEWGAEAEMGEGGASEVERGHGIHHPQK